MVDRRIEVAIAGVSAGVLGLDSVRRGGGIGDSKTADSEVGRYKSYGDGRYKSYGDGRYKSNGDGRYNGQGVGPCANGGDRGGLNRDCVGWNRNRGSRFLLPRLRNWASGIVVLIVLLMTAGRASGGLAINNDDRVLIYGDRLADPQPLHTSFGMIGESFLRIKYPDFSATFRHIGQKFKEGTKSGLADFDKLIGQEKPTVIVLCFGMDDPGEEPFNQERLDGFITRLTEIVTKSKDLGARLYMMTPQCPDVRRKSKLAQLDYEVVMSKYADAVRGIANEQGAELIDWYSASKSLIERESAEMYLTQDGVRPSHEGAALGTALFLEAVGAEPVHVEGSLDWKSLSCSMNEGEISAMRLSADRVQVNLSGIPLGWSPARGNMAFANYEALKEWFVFRLKVTNGPAEGLVFGEPGGRATPVLGSMLEDGIDLATSMALILSKETRSLFAYLAQRNETGSQIPIYEDRLEQEGLLEPELIPAAKHFIEFLHLRYEGYEKLIDKSPKRMSVTLEFARVPDSAPGEPSGGFERAEPMETRENNVGHDEPNQPRE